MPRDKELTLFNKNHIKVQKTFISGSRPLWDLGVEQTTAGSQGSGSWGTYYPHRPKYEWKEVRCESPLGFYYTKQVRQEIPENKTKRENKNSITTTITFRLPFIIYQVTFLLGYGENKVGSGENHPRPWELCPGDGSMPDHFITDLKKVLDEVWKEAEEAGVGMIKSPEMTLRDYQLKIYDVIFGNPKGPVHQTDQEKILSHGFDLKESFRKSKEDGK